MTGQGSDTSPGGDGHDQKEDIVEAEDWLAHIPQQQEGQSSLATRSNWLLPQQWQPPLAREQQDLSSCLPPGQNVSGQTADLGFLFASNMTQNQTHQQLVGGGSRVADDILSNQTAAALAQHQVSLQEGNETFPDAMYDLNPLNMTSQESSNDANHSNILNGFNSFVNMREHMLVQQQLQQQQPPSIAPDRTSAATVSGSSESNSWADGAQGNVYAEAGFLGPWSASSAALLGDMALTSQEEKRKKAKRSKSGNVKPKRPLSAYNIFFKEERSRILATIPDAEAKAPAEIGRKRKKVPHGKISFESLAKSIGKRWQEIGGEELAVYQKKALDDLDRYRREMQVYSEATKDSPKDVDPSRYSSPSSYHSNDELSI